MTNWKVLVWYIKSCDILIFVFPSYEKKMGFTHWLWPREQLLESLQNIIYIMIKQNHFIFLMTSLSQDDYHVQTAKAWAIFWCFQGFFLSS